MGALGCFLSRAGFRRGQVLLCRDAAGGTCRPSYQNCILMASFTPATNIMSHQLKPVSMSSYNSRVPECDSAPLSSFTVLSNQALVGRIPHHHKTVHCFCKVKQPEGAPHARMRAFGHASLLQFTPKACVAVLVAGSRDPCVCLCVRMCAHEPPGRKSSALSWCILHRLLKASPSP